MITKLLTPILLVSLFTLFSCGGGHSVEEQLLTEEEKEAEKQAIIDVLKAYNEAAGEKNWAKLVTTLDNEVTFFGTDSGEVSKTFADFKKTMQMQWEEYETFEYGPIQDLYIQLDDYARYANVIFGMSLKFNRKGEEPQRFYVVAQRTLKKKPIEKNWVIQSGILSLTRENQMQRSYDRAQRRAARATQTESDKKSNKK